jgi:hypothetical protein
MQAHEGGSSLMAGPAAIHYQVCSGTQHQPQSASRACLVPSGLFFVSVCSHAGTWRRKQPDDRTRSDPIAGVFWHAAPATNCLRSMFGTIWFMLSQHLLTCRHQADDKSGIEEHVLSPRTQEFGFCAGMLCLFSCSACICAGAWV